jgi:hypothetical protein
MSRPSGRNRNKPLSLSVVAALVGIVRSWFRYVSRTSPFVWLVAWAEAVDRTVGWDRLPVYLGVASLVGVRQRLREGNLYDTETPYTKKDRPLSEPEERYHRAADGSYNDLENVRMGSAGTRFGRNVPMVGRTYPASLRGTMMEPNPREISLELMTRKTFLPVRGLNLLAAAWIQFMVRDWVSHGKGDMEQAWEVPPVDGEHRWPASERPMRIPRTLDDCTRSAQEEGMPPTYVNKVTHWWDGSQIYGSTDEEARSIRSHQDGMLKVSLSPDEMISADPDTAKLAGQEPGFWIGLGIMGALFSLEHNEICKRLREEFPSWTDDELFQCARLVNAALMAKIHTLEWTPAILGHPTLQASMQSNWWGLAGEQIHKLFGRVSDNEMISGIPGSPTDHFGVPFTMTEEFVAVYRMHPLIPDKYTFRSADSGKVLPIRGKKKLKLEEVAGKHALDIMKQVSMPDLLYSFGLAHPGEITLYNYPRSLQKFKRPDNDKLMDLAATDILRTRELGVPRYNEFRELLHLPPVRAFEDLTDDPRAAEDLRRVYKDNIDLVDLMVGLYAEPRPEGFGFSDTAFRIFILMASRRLNSDRFFTKDYTPEVYTQAGLDWIDYNDMSTVVRRHFPDLAPSLRNVKNAFFPWRP